MTSGSINEGAGITRDRLLSIAKGDIIAFLDADDEWFSEKLEIQLEKKMFVNLLFDPGHDLEERIINEQFSNS